MTANTIERHTGETQMRNAGKAFTSFMRDESGQSLIEYALVAGIIGLGAVLAMTSLGTKISGAFSKIGSQLTSAMKNG